MFGIRCRLEGVRPAGNGLGVKGNVWSRKALSLINSVIPLNKQFPAFIGPPEADGVRPIRVTCFKNSFFKIRFSYSMNTFIIVSFLCFIKSSFGKSSFVRLDSFFLNL